MRLTCPNCGAQYEVPDEVIPESGRDVQCSNCGDTWFQHHPDHQPDPNAEEAGDEHPGWDSPPETDPEPEPEADPEPEVEDANESEPQIPERPGIEPAITDVLREEAAREERARATESGGLETQPDLGLNQQPGDADARSKQARARMARLRGLPEDAEPDDDPDPGTRRNLLPDIEEINSSLNSDSARGDIGQIAREAGPDPTDPISKSGFRRGFMMIVLAVLLLVLIYKFSPQLAEKVPALQDPLSAYVDAVNSGRVWLNDKVSGLMGGT